MYYNEEERKAEMNLRSQVLQRLDEKRRDLQDEMEWYKALCKQTDELPYVRPTPDIPYPDTLSVKDRMTNFTKQSVVDEKERIENKYVDTGR